jgi:hypothetical protein
VAAGAATAAAAEEEFTRIMRIVGKPTASRVKKLVGSTIEADTLALLLEGVYR